jgi:phosphate:Na+ symporter
MTEAILRACGGLGLFLLGMFVMTEGLRALAGASLQRFLARFTTGATTGALTGAAATAVIQSSSATSIAAVGFVSAGLLTFPQSLGILFGANIGTTVTGWIVALIGFKFQLGTAALPLVLVGALLRLLGRDRAAMIGQALAGFGLIFVGIDMLRQGMASFEGVLTPASFPDGSIVGMLLLALIGFAITLVTQSSSAGVATAITAVSAGAVTLPQAGALVIGMDAGTTVTAFIASIGGSTAARRTGVAHVTYNLMTGVMALLLLRPFMSAWGWARPSMMTGDPEIVLVAFHTFFNTLGVLLVLPVTGRFAALICWMIPEREPVLTRRLDRKLLPEPGMALTAVSATLNDLSGRTIGLLRGLLSGPPPVASLWSRGIREIEHAIDETRAYVGSVALPRLTGAQQRRVEAALHALDHLDRLLARCSVVSPSAIVRERPELAQAVGEARGMLDDTIRWLAEPTPDAPDEGARAAWESCQQSRESYRIGVVRSASIGEIGADEALAALDAHRWWRRSVHHVWRILHHLERVQQESPAEEIAEDARAAESGAPA